MSYRALKDDLFAVIDYPQELTELIGEAAPWRQFCALPAEVKEKFSFLNHQSTIDADPGYRLRSKQTGRDDKEYFHSYPEIPELIELDGLHAMVNGDPVLSAFFTYSNQVLTAAHAFAQQIGSDLARDIPALGALIAEGKFRSVLRMLHYTNDPETVVIAAQHFDRSLYTLHLYESAPGLQFLNGDLQWTEAPIAHGKTVVFNGYRGEALTDGKLQKTWHRVVSHGKTTDRISLVLFVWSNHVEDYPKEARSQNEEPTYSRIS